MINLNFDYPLEDFKADFEGSAKAIQQKPFGAVPNLQVEMPDGEIREYRFNPDEPLFQVSAYFSHKYGDEEGRRRHLKFHCITTFIFKYEKMLIAEGLIIRLNGQVMHRSNWDSFIEFLLKYKVNPKDNEIPKKALKEFLLKQSGH